MYSLSHCSLSITVFYCSLSNTVSQTACCVSHTVYCFSHLSPSSVFRDFYYVIMDHYGKTTSFLQSESSLFMPLSPGPTLHSPLAPCTAVTHHSVFEPIRNPPGPAYYTSSCHNNSRPTTASRPALIQPLAPT